MEHELGNYNRNSFTSRNLEKYQVDEVGTILNKRKGKKQVPSFKGLYLKEVIYIKTFN